MTVLFRSIRLFLLLTWALSGCPTISASKFAYDNCIHKLSTLGHAMSKEEYAQLLTNLSHGQIEPFFEKLPLQLISLFSFHACNNGRPCLRNAKATISTSSTDDYTRTCTTIEHYLRVLDRTEEPACDGKNDTACAQPRTVIRLA
jgi:hypothetical protein